MKYCIGCGAKLEDESILCTECREKAETNSTEDNPAQSTSPFAQNVYYPAKENNVPIDSQGVPKKNKNKMIILASVIALVMVAATALIYYIIQDNLEDIKSWTSGEKYITASLEVQIPEGTSSNEKTEKMKLISEIIQHRLSVLKYTKATVSAKDATITVEGIPAATDMDMVFDYLTASPSIEFQDADGKKILDSTDFWSSKALAGESEDIKYKITIGFTENGRLKFAAATKIIASRIKDGTNYATLVINGKKVVKITFGEKYVENGYTYSNMTFNIKAGNDMLTETPEELTKILSSGGALPFTLKAGSVSGKSTTSTGKTTLSNGSGNVSSGGNKPIQESKIKNAGTLFTFLKVPDNYHCKLILKLDDMVIANGEYWYKDGKGKLNTTVGLGDMSFVKASGLDFSKGATYFNMETGVVYTCIPSLKVALKVETGTSSFYDQSSLNNMMDPDIGFKGTRAETVDGIQCTVYIFGNTGNTAEIYVRNSLQYVIRCVSNTGGFKTDIYFKDMDLGMVTNGDVLMTNEANNYKKCNTAEEFVKYVVNYVSKKIGG